MNSSKNEHDKDLLSKISDNQEVTFLPMSSISEDGYIQNYTT
jgi:hypothetical protein